MADRLRPVLVNLAGYEAGEPEWIWPGRIPRSETSLLTGDPDSGKTNVMISVVTAFIQGWPLPDGAEAGPGKVLYLDAENGLDELKRRFLAQGMVDWDQLRILSDVVVGDRCDSLNLDRHGDALRDAISEFGPDWVIIDPLVAFHERNEISATEIRGLLRFLGDLAREFRVAVTVVQHPNKNAQAKDLYRVRGSLDFIAAVRAVLRVSVKDDGTRLLAVDKLNIAPKPKPLAFQIRPDRSVEWMGEAEDASGRQKIDTAKEFLLRLLSDGPVAADLVFEAGDAEGLSKRTIQRARSLLPIDVKKTSGDGPWGWELRADQLPHARFELTGGDDDQVL